MVLEKQHETVARWGKDKWIIEQRASYRWLDVKGQAVSTWYTTLDQALQFAIESDTKLSVTGTRNQSPILQ